MDVRAILQLPVHIWVMCDALGRAYPSGYGKLRFTLVMPGDRPPFGDPPQVPGVAEHVRGESGQVVWTQEYGAFIPESLEPATALHRVAVTDVEGTNHDHRR